MSDDTIERTLWRIETNVSKLDDKLTVANDHLKDFSVRLTTLEKADEARVIREAELRGRQSQKAEQAFPDLLSLKNLATISLVLGVIGAFLRFL